MDSQDYRLLKELQAEVKALRRELRGAVDRIEQLEYQAFQSIDLHEGTAQALAILDTRTRKGDGRAATDFFFFELQEDPAGFGRITRVRPYPRGLDDRWVPTGIKAYEDAESEHASWWRRLLQGSVQALKDLARARRERARKEAERKEKMQEMEMD